MAKKAISKNQELFRASSDVIKLGDLFDELSLIDLKKDSREFIDKVVRIESTYKKIMLSLLPITSDADNLKDLNEIKRYYDDALIKILSIRNDFSDDLDILEKKKDLLNEHKEVASDELLNSNILKDKERDFSFCIKYYNDLKNIITKLYSISSSYKDLSKDNLKDEITSIIASFTLFENALKKDDVSYKDNFVYKSICDFLGKFLLDLSAVLAKECSILRESKKLNRDNFSEIYTNFEIIAKFIKDRENDFNEEFKKDFSKIKFSFFMLKPNSTLIISLLAISPVFLISIIVVILFVNNII